MFCFNRGLLFLYFQILDNCMQVAIPAWSQIPSSDAAAWALAWGTGSPGWPLGVSQRTGQCVVVDLMSPWGQGGMMVFYFSSFRYYSFLVSTSQDFLVPNFKLYLRTHPRHQNLYEESAKGILFFWVLLSNAAHKHHLPFVVSCCFVEVHEFLYFFLVCSNQETTQPLRAELSGWRRQHVAW